MVDFPEATGPSMAMLTGSLIVRRFPYPAGHADGGRGAAWRPPLPGGLGALEDWSPPVGSGFANDPALTNQGASSRIVGESAASPVSPLRRTTTALPGVSLPPS